MFFPEKISKHYAAKFKDACCPLRRQVECSAEEGVKSASYKEDPVGDRNAEIESGFLKKYNGRLLILASNECAINCRFCFRRNLSFEKIIDLPGKLSGILEKDKTIKEVILSGGDPLMLGDGELGAIFGAIPKSLRVRIHSRMPVAMPKRFSPALMRLLEGLGGRLVFVSHVNHSCELDKESDGVFRGMTACGAKLLNQSVLLRGVNDDANALAELSEKLFSQGVLPYYLHQLDRAQGAGHFEVPAKRAKAIFAELKEMLPGYLVPRLVREVKGSKSKEWITR